MTIDLPVGKVTSCCFGGPDLSGLFISTSTAGMGPEELRANPRRGDFPRRSGPLRAARHTIRGAAKGGGLNAGRGCAIVAAVPGPRRWSEW